ncbi:MAG: hypothetical protein H8E80_07950 [Desulfobacteraceae bacterium]|uniref:Porin domain-containing protein n=1 Tax=Candidatus Desulfaltia bathyphila TaxID=2841697 RepID=A0A8J6N491_9BACT|nr:hypothetical protein [Candidatus Desulfaltia bathyphila]MBL7205077.1 hypothetical protein [Desulfobacteraceae bacterium]
MKKLTVIAVAAVMLFAIPAMALDVEFSGSYEAAGYYMDNTDLNDKEGASTAYMDMALGLDMVFKVSDKLSVTTAMDILKDKKWGGDPDPASGIDWTKAYLTAKFDMFNLYVGRMGGGMWGTEFGNSETEEDKIKAVKKFGKLKLTASHTKKTEQDADTDTADSDKDCYGVNAKYAGEGYKVGFKVRYLRDMTSSDLASPNNFKKTDMLYSPYIVASVGPVDLEAEVAYKNGEKDFYHSSKQDQDIKALAYHANAAFNAGPANLSIGYAFVEGNDTTDNKKNTAYGYCVDFQPLIILFNDKVGGDLAGIGNLNSDGAYGNIIKNAGYKLLYATASFSPLENITLNAAAGKAVADETNAGWNDSYGVEYNLGVEVALMDNLTYSATFGYLSAGDFWKQGDASSNVDDNTYALIHSLTVEF